ncbi:hypothetical protein PIROE2DRAFT_1236 [Piromyces sp. E2]|nr:hypothetical protein PIROE2DRAFT_1236 [Piromyces sp. E2]|eukprot:OUM70686.1 hypothetical protein PIROE2DRAFT_1236 [Piromyces sp. E2]
MSFIDRTLNLTNANDNDNISNIEFKNDIRILAITVKLLRKLFNRKITIKNRLKNNSTTFDLNSDQILEEDLKQVETDCIVQLWMEEDYGDAFLFQDRGTTTRLRNQLRNYRWQLNHRMKTTKKIIEWNERLITRFRINYGINFRAITREELRSLRNNWDLESTIEMPIHLLIESDEFDDDSSDEEFESSGSE